MLGKVVEVVTVTNNETVAVSAALASPSGAKTVSVPAGKSVSTTFTTRESALAAHTVTVTATAAGNASSTVQTATVAAASCR